MIRATKILSGCAQKKGFPGIGINRVYPSLQIVLWEMELFRVEQEITSSLRGLTVEELRIRAFADIIEDPTSEEQVELFIYVCFFIFTRANSVEYLARDQQTEG
jgi:hypothetical protein